MLKSLKFSVIAAAVAGTTVFSATVGAAQDADTVVATVNDTEITLGHMIMARAGLPEQYLSLPDDVLYTGILDQLVQQTVLAESGARLTSKRIVIALQNEERALRAAEIVERIVEDATTESAILEAYDTQYGEGDGQEFNAAHILVETQEEAMALTEQARNGVEFASLAREHSTGPSGPNGGDLGWFGEGMMVAPFEAAVMALEVGSVSDPVQTQFGWHVIKLNEKRTKNAPSLEEVRAQLEQQVQGDAVEGRIAQLLGQADITRTTADMIDVSLIKDLDLLNR